MALGARQRQIGPVEVPSATVLVTIILVLLSVGNALTLLALTTMTPLPRVTLPLGPFVGWGIDPPMHAVTTSHAQRHIRQCSLILQNPPLLNIRWTTVFLPRATVPANMKPLSPVTAEVPADFVLRTAQILFRPVLAKPATVAVLAPVEAVNLPFLSILGAAVPLLKWSTPSAEEVWETLTNPLLVCPTSPTALFMVGAYVVETSLNPLSPLTPIFPLISLYPKATKCFILVFLTLATVNLRAPVIARTSARTVVDGPPLPLVLTKEEVGWLTLP